MIPRETSLSAAGPATFRCFASFFQVEAHAFHRRGCSGEDGREGGGFRTAEGRDLVEARIPTPRAWSRSAAALGAPRTASHISRNIGVRALSGHAHPTARLVQTLAELRAELAPRPRSE
jgi:hypothetical protein